MFPCCSNDASQSLSYKAKIMIGVAVVVALTSIILLALGSGGALPPQGNLPAQIAGGLGISLAFLGGVVTCCLKNRSQSENHHMTPESQLTQSWEEEQRERKAEQLENLRHEIAQADESTCFRPLLLRVIRSEDIDLFKLMLVLLKKHGKNIATDENYKDILHEIAHDGTLAMLEHLAQQNIVLDERGDQLGLYPIHWAIVDKKVENLQFLIKQNPDRKKQLISYNVLPKGGTLLHLAVRMTSHDCLQHLLSQADDMELEEKDQEGLTAFEYLIEKKGLVNSDYFALAKLFVARKDEYRAVVMAKKPHEYVL